MTYIVLIKTLNQKMPGGKKFIYQPRISNQKENLKTKPKKMLALRVNGRSIYFDFDSDFHKIAGNGF